jgi:type I restriction-modification system DNA methylase subunit
MHFFGWICLAENVPLISQRIAMINVKFIIFNPVQQHIHPFAFLLHGFHFLDKEGTMAIILPHGVLFRGGAEAEIRKKLLKDGHIDTVVLVSIHNFINMSVVQTILPFVFGKMLAGVDKKHIITFSAFF